MLGAIIGDTVGSAYEFSNTKDYNFRMFRPESSYTDDSIMSMAVADWLIKDSSHSYRQLENCMLDMARKYPCPMGGYGCGFQRWLFSPNGFPNDTGGDQIYKSESGRHPYGSWGNGSAMRVSAVGWFFDTLEETEKVAKISAEITHNHPEGIKGAQATAAAIWMARNGKSKNEIKVYIENRYGYDLNRTWDYLNRTYGWDSSCQGTVPEAIICFLESADFEDSVRKSVSVGGDSDTLACINGGIAEAYYGIIPDAIAETVAELLPQEFKDIIKMIRENTAYGKL